MLSGVEVAERDDSLAQIAAANESGEVCERHRVLN
jgi:hypothetical protein